MFIIIIIIIIILYTLPFNVKIVDPWSDAEFSSVWSGSGLFANVLLVLR